MSVDPVIWEGALGLAEHLDFQTGFALLLAVVPGPETAHALVDAIPDALRELGGEPRQFKRLEPYVRPEGPVPAVALADLVREIGRPMADGALGTAPGTIHVLDASPCRTIEDQKTWEQFFQWMNGVRNQMVANMPGPLILVVPLPMSPLFGSVAPDFWSIRAHVQRVGVPAPVVPTLGARSFRGGEERTAARVRPNTRDLADLLADLFDPDELRAFVRGLPDARELLMELPGPGVSRTQLAFYTAIGLQRRGMLDDALFDALRTARPRRAREIEAVARGEPASSARRHTDMPFYPPPSSSPSSERMGGAPPPPDAPILVLASFDPEEVLPGRAHRLRLFLPQDAVDRRDWEARTGPVLLALREALVDEGQRRLHLHLRCVLSLAIRAGAAFHRRSGFSLTTTQRRPLTGQEELWALDEAEEAPQPRITLVEPPAAREIHLLVSVTHGVGLEYAAWRFDHPAPAVRLELAPPGDLGPGSILDEAAAIGLAAAARRALLEVHARQPVPVRIFFAGPVALAVALGRALDAPLDVILMDHVPRLDRYVESFRFRAGG